MMNNVSIPQAVWIACNIPFQNENAGTHGFQYRKRYGLHAICRRRFCWRAVLKFQYRKRYGLHAMSLCPHG